MTIVHKLIRLLALERTIVSLTNGHPMTAGTPYIQTKPWYCLFKSLAIHQYRSIQKVNDQTVLHHGSLNYQVHATVGQVLLWHNILHVYSCRHNLVWPLPSYNNYSVWEVCDLNTCKEVLHFSVIK